MRHRQRAGDLRQLALGDRQSRDRSVDRRIDAEHPHRLVRAGVHGAVIDDAAPRQLAAEEHVLGDRQIGGEHDLLMDEHDAAPLGVDRAAQRDTLSPSSRSVPSVGVRWPARIFIRVDLPAPFSPMIAWARPA